MLVSATCVCFPFARGKTVIAAMECVFICLICVRVCACKAESLWGHCCSALSGDDCVFGRRSKVGDWVSACIFLIIELDACVFKAELRDGTCVCNNQDQNYHRPVVSQVSQVELHVLLQMAVCVLEQRAV